MTSIDKALELCEALSGASRGLTVTELARALHQPPPTVHRLLGVLKRRGYVRQDEDTTRYSLTLKMLDLSFRLLGGSELRLHAYPVLREYVLRTGYRSFIAVPAAGEVTYIWSAGAVGAVREPPLLMHTAYGREMPSHCSLYFDASQGSRRLSCLKLMKASDLKRADEVIQRLGPATGSGQRLICTCAPVFDYAGREVARVGVFAHSPEDAPIVNEHSGGAWELARLISLRLGYLSMPSLAVTA